MQNNIYYQQNNNITCEKYSSSLFELHFHHFLRLDGDDVRVKKKVVNIFYVIIN